MSRGICHLTLLSFVVLFINCLPGEKVTEINDGDTFVLANGQSVRLIGINAPETGEPGADIAKDMLMRLILNKTVRLEQDVTDKDDYERLLRYAYVGDLSVNAEMIRRGYAEMRFYPPDTLYRAEYKVLEDNAIRNRLGLWAFAVFQPHAVDDNMEMTGFDDQGLEIVSWRDAGNYYGQYMIVEGTVVAANNTGKVCFLNFDQDWKRHFTAVIFAGDMDKFPAHPEEYYLKRKVRVQGLIKEYRGKPEIILKSPNQIKVIGDDR